MAKTTVSIFMLTYNQEEFIGQAIEGVLMQKTNFPIQLVIGEDFSKDRTRKLCEKYAMENPTKIKLLPSKKNYGLINNFIRTYKECDGEYIAICDGDDYWIDSLKLQKQVDFLENNLDYNIVFTSFKFLFPDGRIHVKDYRKVKESSSFNDLVFENYISSVTAVFRNKKTKNDFPAWLSDCPYGDWPLYLWATKEGSKIKFLEDETAVYRKEIGVSEKMKLVPSRIALENMRIIKNVYKDSNFAAGNPIILESLKLHRFSYLGCLIREKRFKNFILLSTRLIFINPIQVLKTYLYIIKRNLIKPKV